MKSRLKSEITGKIRNHEWNHEITGKIRNHEWNHEITSEIMKSRVKSEIKAWFLKNWNLVRYTGPCRTPRFLHSWQKQPLSAASRQRNERKVLGQGFEGKRSVVFLSRGRLASRCDREKRCLWYTTCIVMWMHGIASTLYRSDPSACKHYTVKSGY